MIEIQNRINRLFEAIETGAMDSFIAGDRIKKLTQEKESLKSQIIEKQANTAVELDREKIIAYLKMNRQALIDRVDSDQCKNLIDLYVDVITINNDEIKLKLNFWISDNTGGGGGCRTHVRKDDHSPVYEHSLAT